MGVGVGQGRAEGAPSDAQLDLARRAEPRGGRSALRLAGALLVEDPQLVASLPAGLARLELQLRAGALAVAEQDLTLGGLLLVDASSSNGTYVNGAKLDPRRAQRLDPGDALRFGNLNLRLLADPDA